jgi:hypothetical protein
MSASHPWLMMGSWTNVPSILRASILRASIPGGSTTRRCSTSCGAIRRGGSRAGVGGWCASSGTCTCRSWRCCGCSTSAGGSTTASRRRTGRPRATFVGSGRRRPVRDRVRRDDRADAPRPGSAVGVSRPPRRRCAGGDVPRVRRPGREHPERADLGVPGPLRRPRSHPRARHRRRHPPPRRQVERLRADARIEPVLVDDAGEPIVMGRTESVLSGKTKRVVRQRELAPQGRLLLLATPTTPPG